MKYLFILLCAVSSALAADLIPAARLNSWVPGTDVGVDGGIDQYREGGANQRTTAAGLNAVTGYGADNTGATDTSSDMQAMVDALGANQVGYLPIGVYRMDTRVYAPVGTSFKSNYTIRGATFNGDPVVRSTSTNTIAGSGTKTFTVPAGVGWQTGDGVRVAVRTIREFQITSLSHVGLTGTITTATAHGIPTGNLVRIKNSTGGSDYGYDGEFAITSTGANTFTITLAQEPLVSGGDAYVTEFDATNNWMMGTVSSYSGTTLSMTVSSSDGSGEFSDWIVSLTFIDWRGSNTPFQFASNDNDYEVFGGNTGTDQAGNVAKANWVTIVGGALKGDTTIEVSSATGISANELCSIILEDDQRETSIEAGNAIVIGHGGSGIVGPKGQEGALRRQMNRVAGISGTTVTLDTPLAFDLPSALTPKFVTSNNRGSKCGLEDMWIGCLTTAEAASRVLYIGMGDECWFLII